MQLDLKDRKWLFKSLVGSHNYNLNTPESDKDYKVFFLPTFDDLYSGKDFYQKHLSEEKDIEGHDIRKVIRLWFKANVNFLEVLFSENTKVNPDLGKAIGGLLFKIFTMKDKIAKMNLPYLYDACLGMHYQKMDKLEKGTSGTQHLVDKYGMDTKQCLHAYRILDFLQRFHENNFNDFKQAIWYDNRYLLDIKNGEFTLEEYKEKVNNKLEAIKDLEKKYKSFEVDKDTKESLQNIVKEIVKINFLN